MKKIIIALLFCAAFASVTSAQTLKTEDKLEIAEVVNKFDIYTDNADVESFISIWAKDKTVELKNPFGDFKTLSEIRAFQADYVTKGAAVGKRHLSVNLVIEPNGANYAKTTSDLILTEVKEIPYIVATARVNGNLVKTSSGWKLVSFVINLDEGFTKAMQKMQEKNK